MMVRLWGGEEVRRILRCVLRKALLYSGENMGLIVSQELSSFSYELCHFE